MKEIIIGTRGSELALYQARRVASELRSSGYDGEIIEKSFKQAETNIKI